MNWLKYLALPPLGNVILTLLGLLLWRARPWLGALLVALGLGTLLALSTPVVSYALRQGLEQYEPPDEAALRNAEAIVILGGGRDMRAIEFDWEDAPSNTSWRRLAYGVKLHRDSGLPILVSGGRVHGEDEAEAELLEAALREIFGVTVRWVEDRSRSTAENARFSAALLAEDGISTVVLVSQGWHLPRAIAEFERAGLEVVPGPTEFASPPPPGLYAWLPRAYFLRQSAQALHEWLGRGVAWMSRQLARRRAA